MVLIKSYLLFHFLDCFVRLLRIGCRQTRLHCSSWLVHILITLRIFLSLQWSQSWISYFPAVSTYAAAPIATYGHSYAAPLATSYIAPALTSYAAPAVAYRSAAYTPAAYSAYGYGAHAYGAYSAPASKCLLNTLRRWDFCAI